MAVLKRRPAGERTHVSLRLSEERKCLEVIRDRQGGGGQLQRTFTALPVTEDVTTHTGIQALACTHTHAQ